jgi:hypothetical protein
MMKWVDEVLGPDTKDPRRDGRDTYLVQDRFSVHLMGSINNQIKNIGTEVDIDGIYQQSDQKSWD